MYKCFKSICSLIHKPKLQRCRNDPAMSLQIRPFLHPQLLNLFCIFVKQSLTKFHNSMY